MIMRKIKLNLVHLLKILLNKLTPKYTNMDALKIFLNSCKPR
jgi:hypothetical protein